MRMMAVMKPPVPAPAAIEEGNAVAQSMRRPAMYTSAKRTIVL
jgi:hypothetical protein